MKRQFVKAASAAKMLDAFENKLAEMQNNDVESATDVSCSEWIDTDGLMTGEPGQVVTDADLQRYWDSEHNNDPVLMEYDDYDDWYRDTVRWFKRKYPDYSEADWRVDNQLDSAWGDNAESTMYRSFDSSTEEVDEDLEPVKGEESWNEDNVFMLMGYTGGTEGPESDTFDCYGKFFAKDEGDADHQLWEAKQADPERMQFIDNAYTTPYNAYFDDESEVYPDLATLVKSAWIAPNDYDGNMYDDDLPFASTKTEGDSVEAALIVNDEEVADTIDDVECVPINDPVNAALIIDGEEVADTIEDIECQTIMDGEEVAEPLEEDVTCSVNLTDEQRDLLWEVIDKYNTSHPVSGRWEDETAHEQQTIADTFGISLADAKQIMIDELGFDPNLEGHMEGDHWAEDTSAATATNCCGDVPVEGSMNRYDDYFGQTAANKYGDLIVENLSGKTISKRQQDAEKPGGLIYEANMLGIDMWDLLEALEGMCHYKDGRAEEFDDSTYKVY